MSADFNKWIKVAQELGYAGDDLKTFVLDRQADAMKEKRELADREAKKEEAEREIRRELADREAKKEEADRELRREELQKEEAERELRKAESERMTEIKRLEL